MSENADKLEEAARILVLESVIDRVRDALEAAASEQCSPTDAVREHPKHQMRRVREMYRTVVRDDRGVR